MKILLYDDLDDSKIKGFNKLRHYLEQNDFRSADVKKVGNNLYCARLNRADRLLFSIYHYQSDVYALILEYIEEHRYEKSRFLRRGVRIDEERIPTIESLENTIIHTLPFVNPSYSPFNFLDKPISFDPRQQKIYQQALPLIIIGSAGSGKTTLVLEKIKKIKGNILYTSQSLYLVETSKRLYQKNQYDNQEQQLLFLSFKAFIESIRSPEGKPMNEEIFHHWFSKHLQSSSIKDAYKLFEEFRGVISGSSKHKTYLSLRDYLSLGIKQSIFLPHERKQVYILFERYLSFIKNNNYYDINLICYEYLFYTSPKYDAIIIDEIQDLTPIQITLILKTLHQPHNFLLCGDANQIVHPNFFSWSSIKTLFHLGKGLKHNKPNLRTLYSNYRSAYRITLLANNILKIKTCRFGSLDKESHYLIRPKKGIEGSVKLFKNTKKTVQELNEKTKKSKHYAVIVLNDKNKTIARQYFETPLIFTIQEAKGLEYENIILFDIISTEISRYRYITQGINLTDIKGNIKYSRTKDKTNKSSESYKFHINALYVSITRAIKNIYWVETKTTEKIFNLLGLTTIQSALSLKKQQSSKHQWQQEAKKLEQQGRQQHAEKIYHDRLQYRTPKWTVYNNKKMLQLQHQALVEQQRKAKVTLFEYALVYDDYRYQNALIKIGFKPASQVNKGHQRLHKKYFMAYQSKNRQAICQLIQYYGVNFRNTFNQTPLMIATQYGNTKIIQLLNKHKANKSLTNNKGHNAFQISLYLAWKSKTYADHHLLNVYLSLSPNSLSIKIDQQSIKLDKHSSPFFILNLMIALFYEILPQKMMFTGGGFTSHDLVASLSNFPSNLIHTKFYQHHYINKLLSDHKTHSGAPHSLKLFYRIMPDNYLINPKLALNINKQWVNIYDLLRFDQLSHTHQQKLGVIDTDAFYANVLDDMKKQYKAVLGIS